MRGVVYGRAKRKEKMVQRKDWRSSAEDVWLSIYASEEKMMSENYR